ncbi:DUF1206 domain-containing protein [Nocardioides iriomotensis]|uniref:DUF1206 domain-containing protein n=1 Tax=Nocardioides iriomotensis TaxID=715784 RepID=A0A4Q5IXB0_9ACTN|nr:DUF1206 domain-containing protein [Nocardioides iriomotensis]RYU10704.1 DUF1206 domain-containing protein [Nocardioides iriomotensis]
MVDVRQRVGTIDHDDALDMGVRVGLVSYGIVHLLMAWLALQLAFGDREGKVSSGGAMHQLAGNTLGQISLYVVAGGLAALCIWQGIEAAVGHRDEDGAKRTWKRAISAGKVVIYATVGFGALKTATGGGGGGSSTDTWTSKLMSLPFGVILVGLVGLGIIGVGGALVWRGWQEKFLKKLDTSGRTGNDGTAYRWFGKAGYIAKGVAFAIVGAFFVYAALTHDPEKSAGLDRALLKVLEQPFGPFLLAAIAAGIACYGLFCFAWAKHLDR